MQTTNRKTVLVENRIQNPWQMPEERMVTQYSYGRIRDLACDWLNNQQAQIKQSTYANYHYHVYKHIISFISDMYKSLSANTTKVILTTLKIILKYGCRLGVVNRNILEYCQFRNHHVESKILSQSESVRMKDYLLQKQDAFSAGILLCRSTGIRVGELCGLKWGDVNFVNDTFQVKRTVSRIANPNHVAGQPKTILYIRSPKSFTSIREIPIPQYLVPRLKMLRKNDECYILTGTEECTEPRNVQKRFKTLLRRCEMQNCNFHAMRHGFASACFENGNDCKTVSTILGHSSTKITMDIYIHTSITQKKNCVNSIV